LQPHLSLQPQSHFLQQHPSQPALTAAAVIESKNKTASTILIVFILLIHITPNLCQLDTISSKLIFNLLSADNAFFFQRNHIKIPKCFFLNYWVKKITILSLCYVNREFTDEIDISLYHKDIIIK
jgi:hypothetical protein